MKFYNCNCFFSHNIYIKEYNTHFKFIDINQFNKDYDNILPSLGCDTLSKKTCLLQKIIDIVNERKSKEEKDAKRREYLKKYYQPYDVNVHSLSESVFDQSFIKLIKAANQLNLEEVFQHIDILSEDKQIYGFPVFKEDFCHQLIKELDHYNKSNMPKERPNTMNRYGILLDDIGFHDTFSLVLREDYLDPLAKVLYPEWRRDGLDSHKIFTVHYNSIEETNLGYHYDNSEVTFNVCLGKKFKGGEIYFGDMNTVPISESTCILIKNKMGYGLLHKGQQLHGTLAVTNGERINLIMWMRASSKRNEICPKCKFKPHKLFPATHYGDGFTMDE